MILRCTKKLLTVIRPQQLTERTPDGEDWYANLLWLSGRKCLLLTHAATLFTALEADVRAADLRDPGRLVTGLISGGFVMPLTFSQASQWYQNILAAGGCVITYQGADHIVTMPVVVDRATVGPGYPRYERLALRLIGINEFLWLAEPTTATASRKRGVKTTARSEKISYLIPNGPWSCGPGQAPCVPPWSWGCARELAQLGQ